MQKISWIFIYLSNWLQPLEYPFNELPFPSSTTATFWNPQLKLWFHIFRFLCPFAAPFRFTVPSNQLFNCFIEDSIIYTIEVELENAVAVMTQFHSLQDEVALNDSSTRESITGRHEGLLRYTGESESIASWTVQSYVNHTVHTVMMITLFQANGKNLPTFYLRS